MVLDALPAGQPWLFALLLWRTALRQAEALNLEWRDLQFASTQPSVTVRNGKGGRFRVVPAHPELVDAFRSVPHRSPADRVFTGRSGKPLSPKERGPLDCRGDYESGIAGGRHRNRRQGPWLPQPAPQLRPPLVAERPERQRGVRVAGPQQSGCNPQHLPGTSARHLGGHIRGSITAVVRSKTGGNDHPPRWQTWAI